MRIYFVGAHATGKTTMTRYVSRRYALPMITEVARAVLAELETNLDQLRTDMDLVAEYQRRVFERQVHVEKTQVTGFVSDRAFDNLAYAAEHTLVFGDLINSDDFKRYTEWVAQGIVFFIRPHKDLLRDDGVRAGTTWESVLRIDGMIKLMLEQHRIPYLPLESVAMQERARAVDFVLKRTAGLSQVAPTETAAPKVVSLLGKQLADARRT
jgi:nicotinamide riboside kinase